MSRRTAAASRSLGIELESVVKFSARMGKASGTHHVGSADLFVALVAIALQDASVIAKELGGTFPRPAHAKVEDDRSTGPAVLELIGLVVAALGLVALHADRGFIGLDVSAFEQIALQEPPPREAATRPRS